MKVLNIWNYKISMTEIEDYSSIDSSYNFQDLIRLDQIHSNIIHNYDKNRDNKTKWDWILSNQTWKNFMVMAWDCNAICVLAHDRFWILHAWWRWLRDWILEKMIEKVQKMDKSKIKIFVSHSIRTCCYEVQEDFLKHFDSRYLKKRQDWKYIFDMILFVEDVCKKYWIYDLRIYPKCNKCSENFFSHRNWDRINNLIILNKQS